MKFPLTLTTLTLLAASFSGCILIDGDTGTQAEAIVRKVAVNVDADDEDSERIEDYVQTALEYRHAGEAVATDQVTVEFFDETGKDRKEPISRFKSGGTLKPGDVVVIPKANLTSGLVVRQGSVVLAQRDGLRADWLKVEDVPLPVAVSKDGTAKYAIESEGQFRFKAEDFTFKEDESNAFYELAEIDIRAENAGTMEVKSTFPAVGPRLALIGAFHASAAVQGNVIQFDDGRRTENGGRANADAFANGTFILQFDTNRQLDKYGFKGDVWADGDVVAWDEEHPKSSNWHPEDLDHPFIDEEEAYTEEKYEESGEAPPASFLDFLNRLWGMTLGVGDELRFHSGYDEKGDGFSFDYVAQILGEDRRTVKAGSFDTLHISQRAVFEARHRGEQREFEVIQQSTWVDKVSHLPVFEQATYSKSFDRGDVERILNAFGEDAPVTLPDEVDVVLQGETTSQLMERSSDLLVAPVITFGGFANGAATGYGGAFAAFSGLSDQLYEDDYEYPEPMPMISINADEPSDRLVVTSASSGADWSRLTVELRDITTGTRVCVGDDSDPAYYNEPTTADCDDIGDTNVLTEDAPGVMLAASSDPIDAGDYLEFCANLPSSDVQLRLTDTWANAVIAEFVFLNVAVCT